jgi:hypothetical protein
MLNDSVFGDDDVVEPQEIGVCDKSCCFEDQRDWLVAKIEEISEQTLSGSDHGDLSCQVQVADDVQVLIGRGKAIIGRLVSSWYCKRDSRGWVLELEGGRVLEVCEDFTWWRDSANATVYKTLQVSFQQDDWRVCRLTADFIITAVRDAFAAQAS